jgi:hypothetical protein
LAALRLQAVEKGLQITDRRGIVQKARKKEVQAGSGAGSKAFLVFPARIYALNRGKSIKNGQTDMRNSLLEAVAA